MMAKITKGATFSGAVKYVVDKKKSTEIIGAEGVRMKDLESVARSFERQAQMNTRLSKPVGHISLDFPVEDKAKLSNEKMAEIAHEYMARMGITNTQYIIGRHFDKEHPHCHIIFNRVNNDGRTISDQNDRVRSTKICRELTERHGLHIAEGKEKVNRHRLVGKDRAKYKIYDALEKHLPQSKSWMDLYTRLKKEGIEMSFKMKSGTTQKQGVKFSADGVTFNGSKIDRQFSYSKIDFALRQNARVEEQSQRTAFEPQQPHHHEQNTAAEVLGSGLGLLDLPADGGDDPEETQFRKRMQQKRKGRKL